MKAILLSRVSTVNQDLTQQTEEVLRTIRNDGYQTDDITIIEDKESGVKLDEEHRLGLNELKSLIIHNPGVYSCVYAYELSRVGRRAEVNYSIRNFLQQNRVQLIILKPYIKLFNKDFQVDETANMTFAIFNALAENEGYLRKERTGRGKLKAQINGRYVGGWIPFGYKPDPETKQLVVDEEQAKVVRKIFDLYVNHNMSTVVLAKLMNETGELGNYSTTHASSSRIRHLLLNKAYIGEQPDSLNKNLKGEKVRYKYPRIVSDEIFNQAEEIMNNRRRPKGAHKYIYYAKGILKDMEGGYSLCGRPDTNSYRVERDEFNRKYSMNIPINLTDSFLWHLTVQYRKYINPFSNKDTLKKLKAELRDLMKKSEACRIKKNEINEKIIRTQERILEGKIRESVGDAFISKFEKELEITDNDFIRYTIDSKIIEDKINNYSNEIPGDISTEQDDLKRFEYIHSTIKEILVDRNPTKNGHYTLFITFENGQQGIYTMKTYSHKVIDESTGEEIKFEYLERFVRKH